MLADVGTLKPQPRLASYWQIELEPVWFGRWKATVLGKGVGLFERGPRFRARTYEDALANAKAWCDKWDGQDDRRTIVDYDGRGLVSMDVPPPMPYPKYPAHSPQE